MLVIILNWISLRYITQCALPRQHAFLKFPWPILWFFSEHAFLKFSLSIFVHDLFQSCCNHAFLTLPKFEFSLAYSSICFMFANKIFRHPYSINSLPGHDFKNLSCNYSSNFPDHAFLHFLDLFYQFPNAFFSKFPLIYCICSNI